MRLHANAAVDKALKALLALLIAALGALALHPFCGLLSGTAKHSGHTIATLAEAPFAAENPEPAGPPSGQCCGGFASASPVKSADPLRPLLPASVLLAAVAGFASLPQVAGARFEAKPFLAFPPPLSFYARSARIRR